MWSAFEFATKSCIFGLVSNPMAFTAGDRQGDALHHVPNECRSERAANGSSWLLPNAVARSATCILEAFWGRKKRTHPKKETRNSVFQNTKSQIHFSDIRLFAVLHFFSVILELFVSTCCLHDSVRGHEVLKMLCIEQVSMFCTYCWWWPVNSAITNVGCTNSGIFTINSTGEPSGFLFKIFLYIVLYFFLAQNLQKQSSLIMSRLFSVLKIRPARRLLVEVHRYVYRISPFFQVPKNVGWWKKFAGLRVCNLAPHFSHLATRHLFRQFYHRVVSWQTWIPNKIHPKIMRTSVFVSEV